MSSSHNVGAHQGKPEFQREKTKSNGTEAHVSHSSDALGFLVPYAKDISTYKIVNIDENITLKEIKQTYNDTKKLNYNLKKIQKQFHNKQISIEKAIKSTISNMNAFNKKYSAEGENISFSITDEKINDLQEAVFQNNLDSLIKSLTNAIEEIKAEKLPKPNFVLRISIKIKDLFVTFFKKLGLIKTEEITKSDSSPTIETDTNTIEGLNALPSKADFLGNISRTETLEVDREINSNASNLEIQETDESLTNDTQVKQDLINAIINNKKDTVESLITQIDNINMDIGNGWNFLMFAIEQGHIEIAKLLMNKSDINLKATTNEGASILIIAADHGYEDIVKLLIEHNDIDINTTDSNGMSALMIAAEKGNAEIIESLILLSDINDTNLLGDTALDIAVKQGHKASVEVFIDKTYNENYKEAIVSAMDTAIVNGKESIVKLLLKAEGFNINAKTTSGSTALMIAAYHRNKNIMNLLLEVEKIDINMQNKMDQNQTALMIAAGRGNQENVKLLLEAKGIDINLKNKEGKTALDLARKANYPRIVNMIIDKK